MTNRSQSSHLGRPMKKLQAFRELRAAMRDPDRLGDIAVYKSELGGFRATPRIEAALSSVEVLLPEVDPGALRDLPRGTVGREYAELLDANGLSPFRISERIQPELLRRNLFLARYSLLHDVFHVLTGFDTSLAGEAGVWAFVAGQRYRWSFWLVAFTACVAYPLARPWQVFRIWANAWRGARMGRRAKSLITMPIERLWPRTVAELRTAHRIEPVGDLELVAA